MTEWLPHINVSLNALASLLLVLGFVLIKQKKERAHRNVMIATFVVSAIFLVCYLTYTFRYPVKSSRPTHRSPRWQRGTFITCCCSAMCCWPCRSVSGDSRHRPGTEEQPRCPSQNRPLCLAYLVVCVRYGRDGLHDALPDLLRPLTRSMILGRR